jgi:hypothetical protein
MSDAFVGLSLTLRKCMVQNAKLSCTVFIIIIIIIIIITMICINRQAKQAACPSKFSFDGKEAVALSNACST